MRERAGRDIGLQPRALTMKEDATILRRAQEENPRARVPSHVIESNSFGGILGGNQFNY